MSAAREAPLPKDLNRGQRKIGRRLLLIEPERYLEESLAAPLVQLGGFELVAVTSEGKALELMRTHRIDTILLDCAVRDRDPCDLCLAARRQGIRCPLLVLTDDGAEDALIALLEAGASDYVIKPIRPSLLMARIRAHLRAYDDSDYACLPVGDCLFCPGKKLLVDEDGSVLARLTSREAAILRRLYDAGQASVSREMLQQEIWGLHTDLTTHRLETHIYRLRRKLETDPANPKILLFEQGGYRLA